ncbi:initiation factor [Seminavis robusta]|uniref:Initiation factor n=1 Tax=Seminavis robusta TaxID=568900 RepID=A0A9N8HQX0_9STRA|nr:initiation factor [Seminavis robusta]|eukprot:Sro1023_g232540.1 initiation factor (416) ;mRNA; f:25673-26920
MSSKLSNPAAAADSGAKGKEEHPSSKSTKKNHPRRQRRQGRRRPSTPSQPQKSNPPEISSNVESGDASISSRKPCAVWKPTSIFNSNNNDEGLRARDAQLLRWLLNKLTPSNFDKLVAIFVSETAMFFQTEPWLLMRDAIETIITRAALDPRYCAVHARLCKSLIGGDNPQFQDMLAQICQEQVQTNTQSVLDSHQTPQVATMAKKRYVGSKQFIGELFNHRVLTPKQVTTFLLDLMGQTLRIDSGVPASECDDYYTRNMPAFSSTGLDELALEGLCVLLDTAGKALEDEILTVSDISTSSDMEISDDLERCWDFLKGLLVTTGTGVSTKSTTTIRTGPPLLSFRMRHMVLDLIELRQLAWHPVRYGARQRRSCVAKELLTDASDSQLLVVAGHAKKGRNRKSKKKHVHFGGSTN